MLRFISSLLVMLMGAGGGQPRTSRARPGARLRRRRPDDADAAADRALEITERPRARARQTLPTWPGMVELDFETHTVEVPGNWALESAPTTAASGTAAAMPDMHTASAAWAERMRTILLLQERGSTLRVREREQSGGRTFDVRIPTTPATTIRVDDAAMAALTGARAVRFRVSGER